MHSHNPVTPKAELIFSKDNSSYCWQCDSDGILSWGNTALEAQQDWLEGYRLEYLESPASPQIQMAF